MCTYNYLMLEAQSRYKSDWFWSRKSMRIPGMYKYIMIFHQKKKSESKLKIHWELLG